MRSASVGAVLRRRPPTPAAERPRRWPQQRRGSSSSVASHYPFSISSSSGVLMDPFGPPCNFKARPWLETASHANRHTRKGSCRPTIASGRPQRIRAQSADALAHSCGSGAPPELVLVEIGERRRTQACQARRAQRFEPPQIGERIDVEARLEQRARAGRAARRSRACRRAPWRCSWDARTGPARDASSPRARSRRRDPGAARDPLRRAPRAPRPRPRRRSTASRCRAAATRGAPAAQASRTAHSMRRPRSAPRCGTTRKRTGAPRAISPQACAGCTATIGTSPSSLRDLRRRREHVRRAAGVELGGLLRA